jgi:hypothetical protein
MGDLLDEKSKKRGNKNWGRSDDDVSTSDRGLSKHSRRDERRLESLVPKRKASL